MHLFNRSFIPPLSSSDTNQISNPSVPFIRFPLDPPHTNPVLLILINIKPGL
ncbi:hypothetical protein HanRHA438_Chr06g0254911 [Helianthus annuus]|nr:hypothetical protein HanRHA438_Chr06g0254911 [Helianthus annuus]